VDEAACAARFFIAASGPKPARRRSHGAGSGTALVKVTWPKLEALPTSCVGKPPLASLVRVKSSRFVTPGASRYVKTDGPLTKSWNSTFPPLVNETNNEVAAIPDPTANVNGAKSIDRIGSAELIRKEPEKCEVATALAIATPTDASADVVSNPSAPIAPAVATLVGPTESAEAITGSAEGGLDCESKPGGPSAVAIAVTSTWAFENVIPTASEENANAARHPTASTVLITTTPLGCC